MMILELAILVVMSCAEEVYYPIDPNPPKVRAPVGCVIDEEEIVCYPVDGSGK